MAEPRSTEVLFVASKVNKRLDARLAASAAGAECRVCVGKTDDFAVFEARPWFTMGLHLWPLFSWLNCRATVAVCTSSNRDLHLVYTSSRAAYQHVTEQQIVVAIMPGRCIHEEQDLHQVYTKANTSGSYRDLAASWQSRMLSTRRCSALSSKCRSATSCIVYHAWHSPDAMFHFAARRFTKCLHSCCNIAH